MANPAAMRQMLVRMGLSNDGSAYAVDIQGLDELSEFSMMQDEQVVLFCKVLRRPGGTNVAGVNHPGFPVSMRAEDNLKSMCYWLRIKDCTQRPVTPPDVTMDGVRALIGYRDMVKAEVEPELPIISGSDWPKNIEAVEEYLRGCRGCTGVPLIYVVRPNEQVPAVGDDPEANYESLDDQLIARAPIYDPPVGAAEAQLNIKYLADRATVWTKMVKLSEDKEWWSYVRPGRTRRDGRLAFLGLKNHFLGASHVDNMAGRAERRLRDASYSGERRRWNFEKYVRCHIDQHAVLEGLVEHGYTGIDDRSKVRYLMDGIKTDKLDAVKTTVIADPQLRTDFDGTVGLYKDFIEQSKTLGSPNLESDMKVSSVGTDGIGGSSDVQPDMSIEDRYYTYKEYRDLSPAKKAGLKRKRSARGHKSGDGAKKQHPKGNGNGTSKSLTKKTVSKMIVSALKEITLDDKESDDADSNDDSSVEVTRNDIKKALGAKRRKNRQG